MKQLALQALAIVPVFVLHGTLSMLALFAYVLVTAGVSTTNTAKTRNLEQRLNTHVVLINTAQTTANGAQTSANSAQSTANSAQSSANSAQSTANSAQSTANSAQSTANNAQSTANGAFQIGSNYPGTLEVSGGVHASGVVEGDNGFSGPRYVTGGQGGVSSVGSAPGSYTPSYETSLASAINGIINRLNSSGLS